MAPKKKSSRTRAVSSKTGTKTKTPVKKSSTTKSASRSSSSSSSAKTRKKTSTTRPPAKKTAAKNVKKVSKPKSKRGGSTREMDPVTGFAIGTDSQFIAEALIEGGQTRQDIIDWLRENMDTETRTGTEKPISNLVAAVHNKLLDRGFTVEGSFRLVPPAKRGRPRKG